MRIVSAGSRAFKIAVTRCTLATVCAPLVLGACSLSLDDYAGPPQTDGPDGLDSSNDRDTPADATLDATPSDAARDAAIAAPPYEALVLSDSPILYFRLGDGAQASSAKELITGQLATFHGNPQLGVAGAIVGDPDTALHLDGTSGIYLDTTIGKFAGNVPYTLEAWARPTQVGGSMGHVVLAYEHGGDDGYSIYYGDDHPLLEREYGSSIDTATSTVETPLSVYSHLVGTYDGMTQRLYVNGDIAGQFAGDAGIPGVEPAPFSIGGNAQASTNLFIGDIDEVAIYDHVLSDSEIKRHYEVGLGKTP